MTNSRYNIVIVGAGTAGMTCAIEAAQRGLKVAVLEKSDHIGGAMHWSGGHMSGGGTKLQKRKGIDDTPEKHFNEILKINKRTGDLDLIKKAVELGPRTIDWLDDLGLDFAPECPRLVYGHVPYETPRTHYGLENAKSILKVIQPLWNEQIINGNISLFLHHRVNGLFANSGRYDTVQASNKEGEYLFSGDHIFLTTGGYGSNPSFFNKKHPGLPLVSAAYPTATADGHKLLESIGSEFRFADCHLSSVGGIEQIQGSGRCDFYEGWANVLTSVYRQPRDIYVTDDGERFMREDEENADTRERILQEYNIWHFWIIFDEESLMEKDADGNENSILINWNYKKIKEESKNERFLFAANSIEGLAKKTGIHEENLKKTVLSFNQYVDSGKDIAFGRTHLKNKIKKGPFYALKVHASVLVTFGGMKVNADLEIQSVNGNTMNGLYAAGELLGLGSTSGDAFCSGMAITPALGFGRWLGQNVEA